MPIPAAIVALVAADKEVRDCAQEAGVTAAAYAASAFDVRHVTLRTGERMMVLISERGCLAHNSVVRVMIFHDAGRGYANVFDDYSMPEEIDVDPGGTVSLASHETVVTIFEPVYVWNGTKYVFAPLQSHVDDVAVDTRRPYELLVRFAPGASSTVLRGTMVNGFGQLYQIYARAGQRLSVSVLSPAKPLPAVSLFLGDRIIDTPDRDRWSVTLDRTGAYDLNVEGAEGSDPTTFVPYAVEVTIH